jgi:hypothetical protein
VQLNKRIKKKKCSWFGRIGYFWKQMYNVMYPTRWSDFISYCGQVAASLVNDQMKYYVQIEASENDIGAEGAIMIACQY